MKIDNRSYIVLGMVLILLVLTTGCLGLNDDSSSDDTSDQEVKTVDFNSTFDGSDDWFTGTSENEEENKTIANWSYTNDEEYQVEMQAYGWMSWIYAPIGSLNQDYTVEADMYLVSGEGMYGFAFNCKDGDNFYLFCISPETENYNIEGEVGGKDVELATWEDIETGLYNNDEWNHLKLNQEGEKVRVYLNGKLLDEVQVNTSYSDKVEVGVFAWSQAKEDTSSSLPTIKFDNFSLVGYSSSTLSSLDIKDNQMNYAERAK